MAESRHKHLPVADGEKHLAGLVTEEQVEAAMRAHGLGAKAISERRLEERLVRAAGRAKDGKPGKGKLYAVRPKLKG